jgi:HAD superfamily hydrolase (TIGR01509 family)
MSTPLSHELWDRIDTVLVDMDGTLLDLAFDNFFWRELVPARFADRNGLSATEARRRVTARFDAAAGTLAWYCVDHWTRELGLDVAELKRGHRHLIRFLPGAPQFLTAARLRGKSLMIVTNAHQQTLAIKVQQTGLDRLVDCVVCSHDFAAPKEAQAFWHALQRQRPFDPARTLLIEDSLAVLAAASAYGLVNTVAVRRPDSTLPPRVIDGFPAVDGVDELV